MTKEALNLALGALEDIGDEWGFTSQRTVPKRKEAITAIKEALANEALDKMAENARELGLDYEPAQRTWVGLTEDEILLISANCAATHQHTDIHFARAIESKLRSKNCSL
jgi:hypothetical protein